MLLQSVSLNQHAVCLTLKTNLSTPEQTRFESQAELIFSNSLTPQVSRVAHCNLSVLAGSELKLIVSWEHAHLLFDSQVAIQFRGTGNPTCIPILVPQDSLLRVDRQTLPFFIHKVRSPGARAFDEDTTLFLALEAYGWIPPSSLADKASALVVVVYRLLEQKLPVSLSVIKWVNREMDWLLQHAEPSKLGIDTRWGYSLRIAYFYWKLAHLGPGHAEQFMLAQHTYISSNFSIESVPNYFKLALVLGAFALIKSDAKQVYHLLEAMNKMLTRSELWQTPVNFFQSLDKKNLIANYHEVFKLAVMLDPIKLRREWVQDHDMSIDTSFMGDPGRNLVRTILGEHGIKYR